MSFQFASPWALALLFVIPVLALSYILSSWRSKPATFKHAATSMISDLPHSWRVTWRPMLTVMRILIISLVILALARPQIVHGRETISGEGVEIALALDMSGSMASLDFQPQNRLEAAKQVIGDFITERPYDKIGLVVFASEAFSQSPLTLDRKMTERSLEQVELATELGLDDGTAIGLGLANAANMLANSPGKSKVIILLTDGVNNSGQIDPLTAAEAAKALGIKIYTIGAAKPGQVPVPVRTLLGGIDVVYQESTLDEGILQQVADLTGGKYYRAEDTSGLEAIYEEINHLEKSEVEVQRFNDYTELAGYLLIPALAVLIVELVLRKTIFRRIP
jgi:Ca-activated chloride channel family protein